MKGKKSKTKHRSKTEKMREKLEIRMIRESMLWIKKFGKAKPIYG